MDDEQEDPTGPRPKKLSTRQRNRSELIARAIEARRDGEQDLGFAVRDFVMCGLPYKRQKGASYIRRNGKVTLEVTSSGRYGLPFGQDRLIPIWLATAFKVMGQPADNTIRFRCASDIWRAFTDQREPSYEPGGEQLRRLRDGIARVFGATYLVEDEGRITAGMRVESYRLIRRVDLWFHRREHPNQYTLWQNTVELDSVFADDLRRASVPIDLDGVRALKTLPAALDLYVWQAWRSYRLTIGRGQNVEVPVFGEAGLLAQLGTTTENHRKAKQLIKRWQRRVCAAWPECPNEITPDGSRFIVRPALAVKPGSQLSLPGVAVQPPVPRRVLPDAPDRLRLLPPVDKPVE